MYHRPLPGLPASAARPTLALDVDLLASPCLAFSRLSNFPHWSSRPRPLLLQLAAHPFIACQAAARSPAKMAAPLPASRISSLTSSTLPLILERQRSLSLNLSPSPFTESTILKNLALLTAGVRVLELEGKGVRVGAGKQVGREDASRLREGVEKLLALMEGDDEGRQKVSAIRESFQ